LLDGFEISTPDGFSTAQLGTLHPYENNEIGEIETHAYLRQLIEVTPNMVIEFDQVVLVEPPETGHAFGDPEFWDYVIVEASLDGGITWIPLSDGWDSSIDSEWQTLYNNAIDESGLSTAVANETHLKPHQISIDAVDEIEPGSVIQLRFRLLSDPFSIGWGWGIANMRIGAGN